MLFLLLVGVATSSCNFNDGEKFNISFTENSSILNTAKENLIYVNVCREGMIQQDDLSCRIMTEQENLLILKTHGINGVDSVRVQNRDEKLDHEFLGCKLKGWSYSAEEVVIICHDSENSFVYEQGLTGVSEDFIGYLIDLNNNVHPIHLPYFSGIDTELIKVDTSEQAHIFCSKKQCLSIEIGSNGVHAEMLVDLSSGKLIEVISIKNKEKLALFIYKDGKFFVKKTYYDKKDSKLIEVNNGYNLSYTDEKGLSLLTVKSQEDFLDMLLFDFSRFDKNSGFSWGETNRNGRTVWSTFYTWDILSQIATLTTDKQLKNKISLRLEDEVKLTFSNRLTTEEWLVSNRYSLKREPVLFMMHLGIMLTMLNNLDTVVNNDVLIDRKKALNKLLEKGKFVEVFINKPVQDLSWWGVNPQAGWFYFQRHSYIWAEGLPVPFNFVSAICLDNPSSLKNECYEARKYIALEIKVANGKEWRYWPGELANTGWTKENKPYFATKEWPRGGRNAIANISYLNMDAKFIIKSSSEKKEVEIIKSLIVKGLLTNDVALYLSDDDLLSICGTVQYSYGHDGKAYGASPLFLRASNLALRGRCKNLN